jgi:hypothetical protein
MWLLIVLGLTASVFMCVVGRWSGFRAGRDSAWAEARTYYAAVTEQLGNDERELSRRREVEHAEIHDPRAWRDNGAGYQSRTAHDSPARTGGVTPNKEINEDAKVG